MVSTKFLKLAEELGWRKEEEGSRITGDWSLVKRGKQMYVSFRDEKDQILLTSFIDVPMDVENLPMLAEYMKPAIEKELRHNNTVSWHGVFEDSLRLEQCFCCTSEDDSVCCEDAMTAEFVESLLRDHLNFQRRMRTKLNKYFDLVYEWERDMPSNPETDIRIPLGGITTGFITLSDALEYYIKYCDGIGGSEETAIEYFSERMGEIVFYNLCYRSWLREHDLESLIRKVKRDAPKLNMPETRQSIRAMWRRKGKIGNLDIRYIGIRERVDILGHTFCGISDFGSDDSIHVAHVSEPYPCFDEYDVMFESRSYELYHFRRDEISEEKLDKMKYMLSHCMMGTISEDIDTDMLPLVYYNGDSPVALLITEREPIELI